MDHLALSDDILMQVEKPARYIGNEYNSVVKDKSTVDIRFAMCFPDVYEIGMSHLGIQILYDMFNQMEGVWCERVYSPWLDLDAILRREKIPLFALESQDPIKEFDFLGITIQYEMCYTNILQVLDLSQIPLLSKDRSDTDPIVIGGGPCVFNPEPIADFFDLFYIGEGETRYGELLDLYREYEDLTAYKVLFERYSRFSKVIASEIVESFRFEFLLDFSELMQIGIFAFSVAAKNFNFDGLSFKAFWRKIAKNEMMNAVYSEIAQHKFALRSQILEERSDSSFDQVNPHSFSSGVEGAEKMLMDDINNYLFNPRNRIKEEHANMFLEYLDNQNVSYLAQKYNLDIKTARKKINDIRNRIIIDVLGEDI